MSKCHYGLRVCTHRIFLNQGALMGDGLVMPASKWDATSVGEMGPLSLRLKDIFVFD